MSKVPDPLRPQGHASAGKAARPAITRAEIDATLGYIQRHACDGVSPATVVKETTQAVPLGTFSRQFRAATGLTLRAAIRQRQVEEARRLLLRTELTPQYIAEYCGFRDVRSAAHAFLATGGVVPHRLLPPYARKRL
jgi:AraC-like DNA-binding protein